MRGGLFFLGWRIWDNSFLLGSAHQLLFSPLQDFFFSVEKGGNRISYQKYESREVHKTLRMLRRTVAHLAGVTKSSGLLTDKHALWSSHDESFSNGRNPVIDVTHLTTSIPGIPNEELKLRVTKFLEAQQQSNAARHEVSVAREIETMRKTVPPHQFKKFLKNLEVAKKKSDEDLLQLEHLSPMQLHKELEKRRRRDSFYSWMNVLAYAGMAVGLQLIVYVLGFRIFW